MGYPISLTPQAYDDKQYKTVGFMYIFGIHISRSHFVVPAPKHVQ